MLVNLMSRLRGVLKATGLLPLVKRLLYAPREGGEGIADASSLRYRIKALIEQANFAAVTTVHDLPAIHEYWTERHIAPRLRSLGYDSAESFFVENLLRAFQGSPNASLRCASIGSGNCDFEVKLTAKLLDRGVSNLIIECIDFNEEMLRRGVQAAQAAGVARHIVPVRADFNHWVPEGRYDAVLANMSLHHVVNLEGLFDRVKACLLPSGRFITSDMIGRNGHMRWPEALEIVNEYWSQLPPAYRYNHMLAQQQDEYVNFDCSRSGFEGIRAQDILPLLVQRFHFESFFAFANVAECFVDRAVGYNFDPARAWDREFIDRVHARDVEEMEAGRIKPTHMLAAMSSAPTERAEFIAPLSAAFCIRHPAGTAELSEAL
jgi:SAM-dependent methyltransferase